MDAWLQDPLCHDPDAPVDDRESGQNEFTRHRQSLDKSITTAEQKRRNIITQFTDEKWRDELFVSSEAVAKEKAKDQSLPLWVKLLDSNWLMFAVLPLLLWIGVYYYASPLPQAQAARIAGMWFWGIGIVATGSATVSLLVSGEYASQRGRRLYFDGFKTLYKTYRAESGVGKLLAGASMILSPPLRFGLGSFLAVGIPFWWSLSY